MWWMILAQAAFAQDVSVTWQARLIGPTGGAYQGEHDVTVTLEDGVGTDLWVKTFQGVSTNDGYVALELTGPDDSIPAVTLRGAMFDAPVFVGVAVDGQSLGPTQAITSVPRAASVVGSVRLEDAGAVPTGACTELGRIVFATDSFHGCTPQGWVRFAGAPLGELDNPGTSCQDLADQGVSVDGVYYIRPVATTYPVYCDFDGTDGWTLIWKASTGATFLYDSAHWTTTSTLNDGNPSLTAADAKYQAFNDLGFDSIRVCVTTPTSNCFAYTFPTPPATALALFSGGYRNESIDNTSYYTFNSVFGATAYADCPPGQVPGFNGQGGENTRARWGFTSNHTTQACQNLPTDDADGAIGLGIRDHNGRNASAGYTSQHESGTNTTPTYKDAWMWVK